MWIIIYFKKERKLTYWKNKNVYLRIAALWWGYWMCIGGCGGTCHVWGGGKGGGGCMQGGSSCSRQGLNRIKGGGPRGNDGAWGITSVISSSDSCVKSTTGTCKIYFKL